MFVLRWKAFTVIVLMWLATRLNVDITRPRICNRQMHRQNATASDSGLTESQLTERYYRINVTVPFLDDVIQNRFAEGHIVKGALLIPAYTASSENWEDSLGPFLSWLSVVVV